MFGGGFPFGGGFGRGAHDDDDDEGIFFSIKINKLIQHSSMKYFKLTKMLRKMISRKPT